MYTVTTLVFNVGLGGKAGIGKVGSDGGPIRIA